MSLPLSIESFKWGAKYVGLYLISYNCISVKTENRNDVASAIIASLHHSYVTIKTIPFLKAYWQRTMKALVDPNQKAFRFDETIHQKLNSDIGNSIGYLLVDIIPSVVHAKKFDYGIILHHINYPLFAFFCQTQGYSNYGIVAHLLEFSALFNNLRVLSEFLGLNTKITSSLNLLFAVTFLLTRLPLSWIEAIILFKRHSQIKSTKSRFICAYVVLFTLVFNHYYGLLIAKKIVKLLKP